MNDFNMNNAINDVASMLDNLKLVASSNTRFFGVFGLREDEFNQKPQIISVTDNNGIVAFWNKPNEYSKLFIKEKNNVQPLQYTLVDSRKFRKKYDGKFNAELNYNIPNYKDKPVKLWDTRKSYYLTEKQYFLKSQRLYSTDTTHISQSRNVEKSRSYFMKCFFQKASSFLIKQNDLNNIKILALLIDNPNSRNDFDDESEIISWKRSELIPTTNVTIKSSKRRIEDISFRSKKLTTFCKRCQQISVNGFCNNVCHSLKRKQLQTEPPKATKVIKIASDCTANNQKLCGNETIRSTIGNNCLSDIKVVNRRRKTIFGDISIPVKIPKLHLLRKTTPHQSSLVI